MERPEDGNERPEGNAQLEGNEVPVVGLGWQDGMMGCMGWDHSGTDGYVVNDHGDRFHPQLVST